jgi:hypothetical protein
MIELVQSRKKMFELVQAVEYRGKLAAVRCVDHVRFSVVYISTDYYRGNVVLCRPFFLRACDVQTAIYGSGSSLVNIEGHYSKQFKSIDHF